MVKVRFMSASGAFRVEKEMMLANNQQALYEVTEHYHKLGFSNFSIVEDNEFDGARITAKTPGGRSGRNVAFIDWMDDAST